MNLFINILDRAIEKSGVLRKNISVVSDIPFAPATTKNLGIDFFHTMRGRTIAFATGMKLANPKLKVIPVVGDLITIGGNHLVHAARRNMDLLVICINSFVYSRIAGQSVPKSAHPFSPYSPFEEPFNIPHLANSCGAVYTARWTALHSEQLIDSIAEAMDKKGLSVIEVLLPGPNFYIDIETINEELLKFYFENSMIKGNLEPRNVPILPEEKIIVGKFTDKQRPTFLERYNNQLSKALGEKFKPYGV